MSLILDALNRADQERSEENNAPNVYRNHTQHIRPANPIRRWIIEAVIIFIAIAVLVYTQWPTGAPNQTESIPANTAAVVTAEPKPTIADSVESTTQQVENKNIYDNDNVPNNMTQTEPAAIITKPINPSIKTLYKNKQAAAKIASGEKSVAESTVKPIVKKTATPAPADITQHVLQQIPLLSELPVRFQQTVPNIDYSIHVYSEKNGGGFVNLNGSMQKNGAEVAPGLRVIAILKDSVVLDYNGKQFRLTALNSWINFN